MTPIEFLAAAGIIGATLTFIGQAVLDWLQRRRERRGLLKLLRVEVRDDMDQTEHFLQDKRKLAHSYIPGWENTVWKENAARIAQLISERDFGLLANYYASTRVVQVMRDRLLQNLAEKEGAEKAGNEDDAEWAAGIADALEGKLSEEHLETNLHKAKVADSAINNYLPNSS